MGPIWQEIATILVVSLALGFLVRRVIRDAKGSQGGSRTIACGGGCSSCAGRKVGVEPGAHAAQVVGVETIRRLDALPVQAPKR